MCTVCGCGDPYHTGVSIGGANTDPTTGDDALPRLVTLEHDLLARNAGFADANRLLFNELGVFALNLVSSPGSGKTTLLVRTAADLGKSLPMSVIEGDQQTSRDAARIRTAGVSALQINTGKACHLDAHMIGHALNRLELRRGGVLFIENVGNLVCPASFDLGEHHKVVVMSVTEGEDKPLKYPNMFAAADLMIINKIDLLPYVEFDIVRSKAYARRINPDLDVIELSATQGGGLDQWYLWLEAGMTRAATRTSSPDDSIVPAEEGLHHGHRH